LSLAKINKSIEKYYLLSVKTITLTGVVLLFYSFNILHLSGRNRDSEAFEITKILE